MSYTHYWSARNLVGGALLMAGVAAASLAMAQGVPPILPDNFQRFTDARFENLPERPQARTLDLAVSGRSQPTRRPHTQEARVQEGRGTDRGGALPLA